MDIILDILSKIAPLIYGVGGFSISSFINNKKIKKLQEQLKEQEERIRANEMYEKIRNRREVFEGVLSDLICLTDECDINERQRAFIEVHQKYSSLYNEIEDFCTKLLDGVINSEKYIKETVLPILNELADKQVDIFKQLNDYADQYKLDKISRPVFKAFDKYDQILIKYNGGETSYFWKKIKDKRRDSGFE